MVKIELPLALQTEKVTSPQLLNTWSGEGGDTFHRVQLEHNDVAVDPTSKCNGSVYITFRQNERGDKTTTCQSCKKPVSISLSHVKAGLHLPL